MKFNKILIDGNNFTYKNYFTHKGLKFTFNGKTFGTGAAFGVFNSLLHIKRDFLADNGRIFMVWDRGYARKLDVFPDYKKKRAISKDEEEFKEYKRQRAITEELLKYTSFLNAYSANEEADDVIASIIKSSKKGDRILVVSSDKDMFQLVSDSVFQMIESRSKNEKIITPEIFQNKYGFASKDYLIFQMLAGCKGDEIPGIERVGEVTAKKLVQSFSEEEKEELKNGFLPNTLKEYLIKKEKNIEEIEKLMKRNYQIMKLDFGLIDICIIQGTSNKEKLEKEFEKYDFISLMNEQKINMFV